MAFGILEFLGNWVCVIELEFEESVLACRTGCGGGGGGGDDD